jgi:transcription elongation GreA/GreB family factor
LGEDEADPTKGMISFVSPITRLLMGKSVGEVIKMAAQEIEVVAIA